MMATRRRGRPKGVAGSIPAAFAAGVAATLLVVWLVGKHSVALSVVPRHTQNSLVEQRQAETADDVSSAAHTHTSSEDVNQRSLIEDARQNIGLVAAQEEQQEAQQEAQQQQQAVETPNLDAVPHLFLSFGNAAYFELAHNWAKSVQAVGAPYIIAAFDADMMERCDTARLACTRVEFGGSDDFRGDFSAFRAMGALKVRFALSILERHPALPLVVVSDTDTVWLRRPWEYFAQRDTADFFISSDCLSHELEERWQPDHGMPRCGHIAGRNEMRAFNTGLFAARNTPAARAVLKAWADMLEDPNKERAEDPMHRGIDDQLAMNQILEAGGLTAVSAGDPRTVLAFNQTLRLQTLPVALFANGHVAFVQRTPGKLGVAPIVIHATFQRHGLDGKKARLREFRLWHMDPPEYYGTGADAGTDAPAPLRLLAYESGVLGFVEEAERQKYGAQGRRMPLLEKHYLGMSYQLAALRDAMAAAAVLNRVVVVPQLWCWCDSDEHPHILKRCRIMGTDYETPFECPLDFLVAPGALDWQKVPYRHAGFMEHPQVPDTLRHSRAVVRIADSKPDPPFPEPKQTVGHAVDVWPGIAAAELQQAVRPVDSAAVLVLRGTVPGFLGSWDPELARSFDGKFKLIAAEAKWCCFSWGDADNEYESLPYQLPPPLSDDWQPWQAPRLELPDWCDNVSETYGNREFTRLPQHPCAFLRNNTAAALAADDSGRFNVPWVL